MLKHSVEDLQAIAQTADQRYRVILRPKDGGGVRTCYDALGLLKSIHARVRKMILERVDYPVYLHGGVKDPVFRRGQKANAEQHVKPGTLITVDVRQFFPSVNRRVVFNIWHRFFRFPPSVADILTKLTTKDGCLPQGTKTSDLLANLVFWDIEAQVVADFHERGIRYTRLMDDISCSTRTEMTHEVMSYIITQLHAMVRKKNLRLNPKKQTIAQANQRQVATKLVVNEKTALAPNQRSEIRSEVRALQQLPATATTTQRYGKQYRQASGKVSYLKQHHPTEAAQLRAILRSLPSPPPKQAKKWNRALMQ
ncbi:MAG TPA: reverse transcriptase family protein [Candidatus Sulfopaludibacter sp.]|jgi:hypothetical protein|nr:reverse transcriptase family protein [Candidatus Sulfopaludibacter sp.]